MGQILTSQGKGGGSKFDRGVGQTLTPQKKDLTKERTTPPPSSKEQEQKQILKSQACQFEKMTKKMLNEVRGINSDQYTWAKKYNLDCPSWEFFAEKINEFDTYLLKEVCIEMETKLNKCDQGKEKSIGTLPGWIFSQLVKKRKIKGLVE